MAIRDRDDLRQRAIECGIPERMIGAIERYLFDRVEPGDFLASVLANDLVGSVGRADVTNARCMLAYVRFLYNDMPSGTWGSREIVREWLADGPRIGERA